MIPSSIGWPEGLTTLRRGVSHTVFYRGLPWIYPIFHTFIRGETEQHCAERHTLLHTFGRRRSLCASFPHIILRLEPRASSSGSGHTSMLTVVPVVGMVYTEVYPGRHSRREVYTLGIPSWVVGRHTTLGSRGGIPPWYTPMYTPWVYHLLYTIIHPGHATSVTPGYTTIVTPWVYLRVR